MAHKIGVQIWCINDWGLLNNKGLVRGRSTSGVTKPTVWNTSGIKMDL